MKMLYFSTLSHDSLKKLDELIDLYVQDHAIETFRDIENFKKRLSQPTDNVSVVLLAAEKVDLKKLYLFKTQLHRLRLVVILPDKDQETVALGSELRPRFLSYTCGNFSVVKTVLKKHFSAKAPTVLPPTKGNQSHLNNLSNKEQNRINNNLKLNG